MKRLLQTFVENTFLYLYWILLKIKFKKKPSLIKNFPLKIFQVFNNINETKIFNKKIILPYEDVDFFKRFQLDLPYEILEVDIVNKKTEATINVEKGEKKIILPLALLSNKKQLNNSNDNVGIFFNNNYQNLKLKYLNRFHYLPISSSNNIKEIKVATGQNKLAIGTPICISKKEKGTKNKLVVHIFIDALAQSVIEKFGYEIMPNTVKYFKNNGTFYTNTYAQSEWTLSSMAGIFTGKYTNEHLIFHPKRNDKISHTTIADILLKQGYYTYACSNVPKLTTKNGFDKGFNRFLFAKGKDYNYVINEAIEQLESFDSNQYLFLGFFDLHESHKLPQISAQISNEMKDFQFIKLKGNSKDTSILYDHERIAFYKNNIIHFDRKLKRLYNKINSVDKNALVILHSDHGVNFMTKTSELLGREREKVVFLYKNNKKPLYSNEIKEIRELPSMICNDLKLKNPIKYLNRNLAISESIYPNKEYEISLRTNKYVMFYKIDWEDIRVNNLDDFKPKITMYNIDDEINLIDTNEARDDYNTMISIADRHYKEICKNLFKNEGFRW